MEVASTGRRSSCFVLAAHMQSMHMLMENPVMFPKPSALCDIGSG